MHVFNLIEFHLVMEHCGNLPLSHMAPRAIVWQVNIHSMITIWGVLFVYIAIITVFFVLQYWEWLIKNSGVNIFPHYCLISRQQALWEPIYTTTFSESIPVSLKYTQNISKNLQCLPFTTQLSKSEKSQ